MPKLNRNQPTRSQSSYLADFPKRACIFFLICYISSGVVFAYVKSPVVDEVGHFAAGLLHWSQGEFRYYCVNPPLQRLAATLPVCFLNPEINLPDRDIAISERPEFSVGLDFIREYRQDCFKYFFIGRLMSLLLNSIGIILVMLWANRLFGSDSAILAGSLWVFSPMLVAHGSIIGPDVLSACVFLGFAMACDQWIQRKGLQSCILMGLLLGLASSTKSTLIPLALGVQAAVVLSSGRGDLMRTAGQLLISITASVSILWLVYFGEGMGTKLCELELSSSLFVNWISRLIGESGLGCLPSALPPDLLHGIDFQKQEFETPSFPESYLLGTWKRGGWYTYYIVAWLVKTPVPTLLLTAVGAVQILLNLLSRSPPIEESRKHEHASGPALLSSSQAVLLIGPVLLTFLLVSSQTGFNRHLRYLVPCYPFLFLIASSVISKHRATTSRRLVCCAMVFLQAFAFFLSAPNWMSYFNLAAGGSKNGPEVLLGSNLDWGQDIYGIERWKKACKVTDPIFVLVQSDYHPTWLGIDCYSPKLGKGRGIAGPITSYETAFPKGWYLISVNYVYSNGSSQRDWLGSQFREEVPAYTIGNTIHAFFVDSAAIARINGVSNARSDE